MNVGIEYNFSAHSERIKIITITRRVIMYKIFDLSVCHENNATEPFPPTIELSPHEKGVERLGKSPVLNLRIFPRVQL